MDSIKAAIHSRNNIAMSGWAVVKRVALKYYHKTTVTENIVLLQVCDGDMVRAHKLVLSACSPLFRVMLKKNSHPQPMIFLRG